MTTLSTDHRISIGLPVFNGQKYLSQAITSILAQSYTDFELIISDNASTDRTQDICREYASRDPRIRYYRNERNLGATPNFNRVFSLAAGEYFKWAPYDDLIAPEFLSRCVEVLDERQDVVICGSKVKVIDENGAFQYNYDPQPDTSSPKPEDRFRNLILKPHLAVQSMGLARAELLKQTGLMGGFPSSDEVFLAELSLLGRFYEIPEPLYYLRLHPEQSTQGSMRSRTVWFDASLRGKIVLAHWMYFLASLRVVRQATISRSARISCYLSLGRWILMPPHFRALGKDVLLAAVQLVRSFGKTKPVYQEAVHPSGGK